MYFPGDIIIHILLKLPIKSLGRCKLVCKSWRSLIEDRQFINCHKILLACWCMPGDCEVYSIDDPVQLQQHDSVNVSFLELPEPQVDPDQINVFKWLEVHGRNSISVDSCNGLFLLCFSPDIIVLWNPTIRESRIIPPSPSIEGVSSFDSYGLGGHVSDYKIIRVERTRNDSYYVQIFSIKTNAWKLIGKLPRCDYFKAKDMVVDEDGFVYMITHEKIESQSKWIAHCMCLKNEKFEEILFPDAGVEDPTLFITGENILAMQEMNNSQVLYCMEKKGMRSSWRKIYAITKVEDPIYCKNMAFTKDRDLLMLFLLDDEYFEFEVYDSKRQKFKEVKVKDVMLESIECFDEDYVALPYVETLLSPNAL